MPAPPSAAALPTFDPAPRSPDSAAVIAPPGAVHPSTSPTEKRATEKRPAEKPRDRPAPDLAAQQARTPESSTSAGVSPRPRPLAPVQGAASSALPGPLTTAPGQGSAAAPSPAAPVFAQADLPEAIRSQLPVLKISGATYSNNPAHRMAIVNGQVLLEGDQAGPGLVLERVEPSRTVWAFRGYRYAVGSQ
jgi:general secretion pathway protein B